MNQDDELDRAVGEWLVRREDNPKLLPGEFARELDEPLRSAFLAEIELIAEIDRLATGASPRDLPVRFGDFRVLGELGRGGMGAVYAAEQISIGRRVALKVIHAHIAGDLRSAARFQREARTAASLVHPGIVPVLGFGHHEDSAWLAMGLVEGRSLQRLLAAVDDPRDVDHVRARRLLDDPKVLAMALADVADALDFAHRRNVVHRDVKPANLMWSDEGHLIVLDFGLAMARDTESMSLTRTGDFLGTPLYMAPEQAQNAQSGTARSDVYSLGAVLYECLCHRPPVASGPLPAVIDAILNQHAIDPRRVRTGVSPELANIALQCLEKDPQRRYATAAALADDLRRFVDGDVVRARGTGLARQFARQVQRRPLLATILTALVVLTPIVVWAWMRSEQATTLQASVDLSVASELLAMSPEGITAFGGASVRFYREVGLGENLLTTGPRISKNAEEALRIVEHEAALRPEDVAMQRGYARILLDIGADPVRTDAVLETLVGLPDANAADRAMLAVWQQLRGVGDEAKARAAFANHDSPEVSFWEALWLQHRQDYFGAIVAFDRALANVDLGADLRYFALLHRGWCKTCPDVCRIREAEEDMLQAAALRPRYGTARLLWAALRCMDPADDLSRPVAAVTEVLTAVKMEPWVVILTARVLLALAEGGIRQAGPVHFGAEFSPIANQPIPPGRGEALAGTALGLLDAVLGAHPGLFEAQWHRVAALALLGRHDAALAGCASLQAAADPAHRAAVWLQQARVQLAAGRAQLALRDIDRCLGVDDHFALAWQFRAEVLAYVGDLNGELAALERSVRHLADLHRNTSVFPDAATMLPELQLRRMRLLASAGRFDEAEELLRAGDFGSAVSGGLGPRVRMQIDAQVTALRRARGLAASDERVEVSLPGDSPLQLLRPAGEPAAALPPQVLATGLLRGWGRSPEGGKVEPLAFDSPGMAAWVPAMLDLQLADVASGRSSPASQLATATPLYERAVDASASGPFSPAALLGAFHRGEALPDAAALPLGTLIPHLPRLLAERGAAERLLAIADQQLAIDADNAEARLVRASILYLQGQYRRVVDDLSVAVTACPDDLRSRYLLAAAAIGSNQPDLARQALMHAGHRLEAAALERARAAMLLPFRPEVVAAVAALQ